MSRVDETSIAQPVFGEKIILIRRERALFIRRRTLRGCAPCRFIRGTHATHTKLAETKWTLTKGWKWGCVGTGEKGCSSSRNGVSRVLTRSCRLLMDRISWQGTAIYFLQRRGGERRRIRYSTRVTRGTSRLFILLHEGRRTKKNSSRSSRANVFTRRFIM